MPTVNIYYNPDEIKNLERSNNEIKVYIAQMLSCGDRLLEPKEISIRIIESRGKGMSAPVEIDITAHNYQARIEKQDEICEKISAFCKKEYGLHYEDIKVWLKLCELGHNMQA